MAVASLPKVEAVTMSIQVPKDLKDRFVEAARIISEITPKKPVGPDDLVTFALFKETTGTIVIEFLEFVHNCDGSPLSSRDGERTQAVRANGH